jgi:protein gp37
MAETSIEWTDATWNPVAGCTVLTAGCTNCYAMRMAARLDAMGVAKYRGLTRRSGGRSVWTGKVRTDVKSLEIPRAWSKPRKVFVNSMSDLFHEDVPATFIQRVWGVMKDTPRHTYQILTKRPARMADILSKEPFEVLPNVWLGTSVEDGRVLHRLDEIRRVPAAIRFVSLEPLIGSVAAGDFKDIQWAIVGGESGPHAREMKSEWVEEIQDMCRQSKTAFFFKQWGGARPKSGGRMLNGQEWNQYPDSAAITEHATA